MIARGVTLRSDWKGRNRSVHRQKAVALGITLRSYWEGRNPSIIYNHQFHIASISTSNVFPNLWDPSRVVHIELPCRQNEGCCDNRSHQLMHTTSAPQGVSQQVETQYDEIIEERGRAPQGCHQWRDSLAKALTMKHASTMTGAR